MASHTHTHNRQPVCVAGMEFGSIGLHSVWQAASVDLGDTDLHYIHVILCGRYDTSSAGLSLLVRLVLVGAAAVCGRGLLCGKHGPCGTLVACLIVPDPL